MSLLKMKLIVLIDRFKQITAVANALQIKQPTVSFHMKKLEEEWGVKLFETKMGKVLLTKNGKLLLHYATQIDQLYEEASTKLTAIGEEEKHRFVIGCTSSTAAYASVSDLLIKLERIHTEANFSFMVSDHDELLRKLQLGTIDLMLHNEPKPSADKSDYVSQLVDQSPLRIVVPEGHELAKLDQVNPRALQEHSCLMLSDSSLVSALQKWGLSDQCLFKPVSTYSALELLRKALPLFGAFTMLPAVVGSDVLWEDGFKMIATLDSEPPWEIQALWRKQYWDQEFILSIVESITV